MRLLSSIPIRYKLFIIVFLSSMVLLVHTIVNVLQDFSDAKAILFSNVQYQAGLIAKTTSPGLLFDVPSDANDIINELVDDTAIVIFNRKGERFASFEPERIRLNFTDISQVKALMLNSIVDKTEAEFVFEQDRLIYLKRIVFDKEFLGHVYLEKDLSEFQQDINQRLMMTLTIFSIALLAALVLAWLIQGSVTEPIQNLARSIKSITAFKDYSVRAEYQGKDEIADLVRGFNSMLEQIQFRDQKLSHAKSELEVTVDKRTRQLRLANEELQRYIEKLERAQKQAFENELAKEKAETREKAKTDFLTHMSHELRTPLNGIDGMLSLLKDTQLLAQQQEYVNLASDSSAYLLMLLSDILDLAKVENESFELEQHDFDLVKVLEGCLDIYTQKAHAKHLDLALDFSHDFQRSVNGDSTRLKQLVNNLISNAIKFTHEGYIHITASTVQDGNDVYVTITVKDSGIGISPQGQRDIFKAFSQADSSTTREYGGTGIGLALCKKIAEAMNGGISVDSNEGVGSIFFVSLQMHVARKDLLIENAKLNLPKELALRDVVLIGPDCLNIQQLKRFLLDAQLHVDIYGPEQLPLIEYDDYQLLLFFYDSELLSALTTYLSSHPNLLCYPILWREDLLQDRDIMQQFTGYLTLPIFAGKLMRELAMIIGRHSGIETDPQLIDDLSESIALSDAKILLVEDNEVNQKVAKGRLDKLGVEVVLANNGLEALEAFQQQRFDLILMDCQMPVVDGYQATRNIRQYNEWGGTIPIIAITANAIAGDRERCLNAGMDDYITKPIKQDILAEKVQFWLNPKAKRD